MDYLEFLTRRHITKLDPKSVKCVLLEYLCRRHEYQCHAPLVQRYIVSRDVTFHEHVHFFPMSPSYQSPKDDEVLNYLLPTCSFLLIFLTLIFSLVFGRASVYLHIPLRDMFLIIRYLQLPIHSLQK